MAYPNFYNPYQQPYYQQPIPDQLAQLRQGQYQQNQTMQQQAPEPQPDNRIWVAGENAANSYYLVPNAFVRLWDSTAQVFYEKRTDSQGKPLPMEIYDYKRRGGEITQKTASEPVNYMEQIEELRKRIENLEDQRKKVKTKETPENEQ